MDADEEKTFIEFIDKHKSKLQSIDSARIAHNDEEFEWLKLYRLFSEKTKDNFRKRVLKPIKESRK